MALDASSEAKAMAPPEPELSRYIGRRRYRRAGAASIANVIGKGVAAIITMATIPIVSHYLGRELFGLWMIIISLTALIAFSDFGIGNGLLNAVALAEGRSDDRQGREVVSSGMAVLALVGLVFIVVSWLLVGFVDWTRVFHLHDPRAVAEVRPAISVFCVVTGVNIFAGATSRVQLGMQKGYIPAIWQMAGSGLGFLLMLVVVSVKGSFSVLIAAVLGAPVMCAILNGAIFFGAMKPEIRPSIGWVSVRQIKWIAKLGMLFFTLQVVGAVAYSSDNVIAGKIVGAAAVGDYAVAASVFAVCSSMLAAILQPLWPAYGEAIAREDSIWVAQALVRSTVAATLAATLFSAVTIWLFDEITKLWLHRTLDLSRPVIWGLAIWAIIQVLGNSLAMFLNGAHVVRLQMALAIPFAVSCVLLKIILVNRYGLVGLPWATIATYVPISLVPVIIVTRKLVRRLPTGSA